MTMLMMIKITIRRSAGDCCRRYGRCRPGCGVGEDGVGASVVGNTTHTDIFQSHCLRFETTERRNLSLRERLQRRSELK